jgi:hypothetical protein
MSRSPDSVVEETAAVSADELTDAQAAQPQRTDVEGGSKSAFNPAYQQFYSNFVSRYYGLFQSKFAPYRQRDDKQLTKQEFDDLFLNTSARLDALKKGDLNFEDDRADLETLNTIMSEAADKTKTLERLRQYQAARKVPVSKKVQRTRTSLERGWDSTATFCPQWYDSPVGCSVIRPVQTAYTETVTTMEFPQGTQSHAQIFRAFQDRYFSLLQERRDANSSAAEKKRQDIIASIGEGRLSLLTALEVLGGFLALMFFFLLIAIERHQRRISETSGVQGKINTNDELNPAAS